MDSVTELARESGFNEHEVVEALIHELVRRCAQCLPAAEHELDPVKDRSGGQGSALRLHLAPLFEVMTLLEGNLNALRSYAQEPF